MIYILKSLNLPKISIKASTFSEVQRLAPKGSKAFNSSTFAAIYSALEGSITLPTISKLKSLAIVWVPTSDVVGITDDVFSIVWVPISDVAGIIDDVSSIVWVSTSEVVWIIGKVSSIVWVDLLDLSIKYYFINQ